MRLDQDVVKYPVALVLAFLLITIAAYLWLIDIFSQQRVFGMLLGSELVAFAMLAYVHSKPSFLKVSKAWLLLGSMVLAVFLFLVLTIATQ
jgi:hypothetical protein